MNTNYVTHATKSSKKSAYITLHSTLFLKETFTDDHFHVRYHCLLKGPLANDPLLILQELVMVHIYSNIRLAHASNENCTSNEKLVFVVQIRRSLLLCSHGNYDITCRPRQDNSGIQMNMILLRIHCFHLENYMVLDLIRRSFIPLNLEVSPFRSRPPHEICIYRDCIPSCSENTKMRAVIGCD
ncbi:unnamed protein product, partial [Vitis vinifera]